MTAPAPGRNFTPRAVRHPAMRTRARIAQVTSASFIVRQTAVRGQGRSARSPADRLAARTLPDTRLLPGDCGLAPGWQAFALRRVACSVGRWVASGRWVALVPSRTGPTAVVGVRGRGKAGGKPGRWP